MKPVEIPDTTLTLAHKQTAENLIGALNTLQQARAQAQQAEIHFQLLVSGILSEHGIETADIVSISVVPPVLIVKIKTWLKKTK